MGDLTSSDIWISLGKSRSLKSNSGEPCWHPLPDVNSGADAQLGPSNTDRRLARRFVPVVAVRGGPAQAVRPGDERGAFRGRGRGVRAAR